MCVLSCSCRNKVLRGLQVDLATVGVVRAAVTRQLLTCVSDRLVWMQMSSFSASVGYLNGQTQGN